MCLFLLDVSDPALMLLIKTSMKTRRFFKYTTVRICGDRKGAIFDTIHVSNLAPVSVNSAWPYQPAAPLDTAN